MADIIWDSELGPSWPDDWEHTTVHAQFVAVTGDGADTDRLPDIAPSGNGEVIFTPSLRTVRYVGADGPYVVSLKQYRAVVDSEGYLCTPDQYGQPGERGIVLPSTDAPVIEPRGEDDNAFTWRVDFDLPAVTIRSDHISVPVGGPYDLVDLLSPERAAGVVHIIDRVSARDAMQAAREARQDRAQVESVRDETEGLVSGATSTLADHGRKLERVEPGDDRTFRVRDHTGQVAFEVTPDGRTRIYDMDTGKGSGDLTTLHVFVAAGQSNMQGRGFPVEGPQSPRVMQYGANRRVLEQAPLQLDMVPGTAAGTSPASFFAHHYIATQPAHVGVLLIPAAYGGTKFGGTPENPVPEGTYTWTRGAAHSPEYDLYERSLDQTLEAMDAAKNEGYHVIAKGVLWHQGEGNGGMATEAYAALLDNLIADYRADLDHPTLPFLVGQQSPEGMEVQPAKYTVDAAHQDTPYRTPFTGFAPATWDGHNDGDTTHFSTVGTSHLGDTYMTAYTQALGNTLTYGQLSPKPISTGVYEIGA